MSKRVSSVLNRLIDELRVSLGERTNLVRTNIDKEAKIIAALVECREKIDEIARVNIERDRELAEAARRPSYARPMSPPRYIDPTDFGVPSRMSMPVGDGSGPGADAISRALNRGIQDAERSVTVHMGIRNPLQ